MSSGVGDLQANLPAPASRWVPMFAWSKLGSTPTLEHSEPPTAVIYTLCVIAVLVLVGLKAMSNVPCDRLQPVVVSLASSQPAFTKPVGIGVVNCVDAVRVGQVITDPEEFSRREFTRRVAGVVSERTYGSVSCLVTVRIESSTLLHKMQLSPSHKALIDVHVEDSTLGDSMFAIFKNLNGKKGG